MESSTGEKMIELSVFMFCLIGCGISCHALGRQQGIEQCVEHLIDEGIIDVEDE